MNLSKITGIKHLALLLVLLTVTINTHAQDITIGDLRYTLNHNDHTASVYGTAASISNIHNLVIPENITYRDVDYTVTAINGLGGGQLTGTLTIPNTITKISSGAFSYNSGLTGSLTIPNSVKTIEERAFEGCTGLNGSLTLSNSLTTIGRYAFFNCSGLTGSLVIPNSVTSIGAGAFSNCKGFNGTLTLSNSLTEIGDYLTNDGVFEFCSGFTGPLVIPNSVQKIHDRTFAECSGFNGPLVIPNSVKTIGGGAFALCSGLTGSLNLPGSISEIGGAAFSGCSKLTGSLVIPGTITEIEFNTFSDCHGLTSLSLPNSVTDIGDGAFDGCSGIKTLHIPSSLKTIGLRTFAECTGLTALTIPETIESIGPGAFIMCTNLTELNLPESLKIIDERVFSGCNNLTSVTIPNSVRDIGYAAFYDCKKLRELIIGSNVGSIDSEAFGRCVSLGKITCTATTPPDAGGYSFNHPTVHNTALLLVPSESLPLYKEANEWKEFLNIRGIGVGNVTGLTLDRTEAEMTVGETLTLIATVTPDDATDKTISWNSSHPAVASVDTDGLVSALAPGTATITATASAGITATCTITVVAPPASTTEAGISTDKLREGSLLKGKAEQPGGGYADDWSYEWTVGDEIVSDTPEFSHHPVLPNGDTKTIENITVRLHMTNMDADGNLRAEINRTFSVAVYRAPIATQALLRKGDGTTHTLIAMSAIDDSRLQELDYTFVYGYTGTDGTNRIAATTGKRYCQIDEDAFNDASTRKWCYAQWTYTDGSVVTSGKRYLDGSIDEEFDGSSFSGSHALGLNYSEPDNWIKAGNGEIDVTVDATSATDVQIYTPAGQLVLSRNIPAGTLSSFRIDTTGYPAGIYIVTVASADSRVTKKIAIR